MVDVKRDNLESLNDSYFTLEELLHQRFGKHARNHTLHKLKPQLDSPFFQELCKMLEHAGFKMFKFFSAGKASLVLMATDNQLVRLHFTDDKKDHIKHPAILQPIKIMRLGDKKTGFMKIEVMSRVITGKKVKREHEEEVERALNLSGYDASDIIGFGNVGLIRNKNGELVPMLIDPDGLHKKRPVKTHEHLKPRFVNEDGTWVQCEYDSRIMSGKPSKVFDDERLAKLETTLTGERKLIERFLGFFSSKWKGRKSNLVEALRETRPYDEDGENIFTQSIAFTNREIMRGSEFSYSELLKKNMEYAKKRRGGWERN